MTVYNEEDLLPGLLENISPHVDEIIAIDGSPEGASTDNTKATLEANDKVVYMCGTYKTVNGIGWDMARQRMDGINLATGDVYLFLSADMLFLRLEQLREAIEQDKYGIFFCNTLEFWQDTKRLRLYSADCDVLTVPAPILEPIAVDKRFHPFWEEGGRLNLEGAEISDRMLLAGTLKFHMGWIRPFGQQVSKHIRNVKQGRWLEHGENLLASGERKLTQWAITETMSYEGIPSIAYSGELPKEMAGLLEMKYNTGLDTVLKDYEDRYGISPFRG
jgi:glycosyltransferase involved in cell wall biosynthesis